VFDEFTMEITTEAYQGSVEDNTQYILGRMCLPVLNGTREISSHIKTTHTWPPQRWCENRARQG